jgi:hypothetical protein
MYHKQVKGHGYWKEIGNQRAFFDKLAKDLKITRPEEWYRVSNVR